MNNMDPLVLTIWMILDLVFFGFNNNIRVFTFHVVTLFYCLKFFHNILGQILTYGRIFPQILTLGLYSDNLINKSQENNVIYVSKMHKILIHDIYFSYVMQTKSNALFLLWYSAPSQM